MAPITRSKIVIASLVVVFLAVGAWITMGEMVFALHQRILLDAEGEPVATSVLGPPINICPVAPVCPPLPTCPEPFPIERTSEYIFPVKNAQSESPWVAENHRQLRALFQCLENRDCGRNQATVVILGSYHFQGARMGWNGGEDIWARSTINALDKLGYTYIHSVNMERTIQLYHMMPHLVKAIIVENEDAYKCFEDKENCVLSETNPDGIPAWKLFSFFFWPMQQNPLGSLWTLNPEKYTAEHPDWDNNTYIGYSVEDACQAQRFIPHHERKAQAYVMTKRLAFFTPGPDLAWPPDFYESASQVTGIKFVVGAADDDHEHPTPQLPTGLVNYGQMSQPEFLDHVSHSQVLVGLGNPATSPTPYDALCLGVPFINPILQWDHDNPFDRSEWSTQHGTLSLLDPPYVYNVFSGDREGFIRAIKEASSTPIESYVLEPMRNSAIQDRLDKMLHRDWKGEAAALLDRRKNGEDPGPLFVV